MEVADEEQGAHITECNLVEECMAILEVTECCSSELPESHSTPPSQVHD